LYTQADWSSDPSAFLLPCLLSTDVTERAEPYKKGKRFNHELGELNEETNSQIQ
jgi:hypothetical protein